MRSITKLLKCAERELAIRRNTYPKWVQARRMKAEQAREEIECMEDIVVLLRRQKILEEVADETLGHKSQPVEVAVTGHIALP